MEVELEARIAQLLLRAARRRKLVPYGAFHALFPPDLPLGRRYVALEHAASGICEPQLADYAALLSTDSGLPGPDFYARFKRLHAERYYAVLGADRNRKLRLVEKQTFAHQVRQQVYRHARASAAAASTAEPSADAAATGLPEPARGAAERPQPGRVLNAVLGAVVVASGLLAAPAADAQEFSLFGGGSRAGSTNTYTWAFNYQEGLGQYFAGSFTWLNEGHIPDHHRDGQLIQLWGRIPVGSPKFVLQAGLGPYRYFDTTTSEQGGSYSDTHGWGVVYSVRAAYYASSRWVTQLQLNRVHVQRGPDATSVMFGVGYQLDAPDTPGPRDWAASSTTNVTNNEVAVYLGKTIVNSTSSPSALGGAVEYRRGLAKYLDVTVGYLHEGSSKLARRDGITSQLWATRAFLNDKVTLGVGAGAYYAINENENSESPGPGAGKFSGLVTIAGSYRFTRHWDARLEWNRVVTRYDRDTDVIFAGVGYRF
jgi:hypothetical protein